MVSTEHDIDAALLFRNAEIRAERLVAIIRMVIATGLGLSFVVAVWPGSDETNPVLVRQWLYAGSTMVAYFVLGLGSWLANRRGFYRPWMAWPSASVDCLFVLAGVWLSMSNVGLSGNYVFIFPSVWLAPLVLTFGALRFNPLLQAYITFIIVAGLFLLVRVAAPEVPEPQTRSVALFFASPPNYMRVSMLGLAGLVLVVASVRARGLLLGSITETRARMNLTRYLPAQLAPRLAEGGLAELQRGKRQHMGILFIDMRGFTRWSQHQTPQAISEFMTEFRRRISDVANATGGIIDKFMGDAAMILYGDEPDAQAAASACVECAKRLDREMAEWSQTLEAAGKPAVRVGVGLHWGEVFSGVVGGPDRLEYSVFGDTVNIAARLEQMTKEQGVDIVASRDILERAGLGSEPEGWVALADATVRGRTGTIQILGCSGSLIGPDAPDTFPPA